MSSDRPWPWKAGSSTWPFSGPRGPCAKGRRHGRTQPAPPPEIYRIIFGASDKRMTSAELRKLGFDDSEEPDEVDFI